MLSLYFFMQNFLHPHNNYGITVGSALNRIDTGNHADPAHRGRAVSSILITFEAAGALLTEAAGK